MGYSKRLHEITDRDLGRVSEEALSKHLERVDAEEESYIKPSMQWSTTVLQQEDIISEIVENAEEGEELEAFCALKQILKLVNDGLKQIEQLALDACDMHSHNNAKFISNGFEIKKISGSKIVDFSNVPEVMQKQDDLNKIKETIKHALTGIERGATMLSGDKIVLSTGELVNVPSWKYKKDYITVKKL